MTALQSPTNFKSAGGMLSGKLRAGQANHELTSHSPILRKPQSERPTRPAPA